ncbi:MAG: hypothetical protein J0M01_15730 [Dechloromonas sp.]|nr:hypothetical protein [Dechloromonas sp.]
MRAIVPWVLQHSLSCHARCLKGAAFGHFLWCSADFFAGQGARKGQQRVVSRSSFDGMGFAASGSNGQSQQTDAVEQMRGHGFDTDADGKAKPLLKMEDVRTATANKAARSAG